MENLQRIQEIVFDYCKNMSDAELVLFIDTFCMSNYNETGSKISEEFIKNLEIEDVFIRYIKDCEKMKNNVNFSFYSTSLSERNLIENIKISLFVLSYKRLTINVNQKPKTKKIKLPRFKKIKLIFEGNEEIHAYNPINSNYTLCSDLIDSDMFSNQESSEHKITCKNCLNIINTCKSKSI